MQFTRVVSLVEEMEIWNASSDGFSFVISNENRTGRREPRFRPLYGERYVRPHVLDAPRRHVAEHGIARTEEDDTVACRIAAIYLHFGIRHRNARAWCDMMASKRLVFACIRNHGDVVITIGFKHVGIVSIGGPTA
jgi:hypothetical protein